MERRELEPTGPKFCPFGRICKRKAANGQFRAWKKHSAHPRRPSGDPPDRGSNSSYPIDFDELRPFDRKFWPFDRIFNRLAEKWLFPGAHLTAAPARGWAWAPAPPTAAGTQGSRPSTRRRLSARPGKVIFRLNGWRYSKTAEIFV